MADRRALIVWGGWDGHEPEKVALFFEQLLKGEGYEVGLHYMYRLDRSDFESPVALHDIALKAGKSEKEFRDRFGYLVGLGLAPWE